MSEEFKPTVDVVRGAYVPVDEEDAALLINEHHVLDIGEVVRQAVLLEVPMQVLCRPDCAGLCQTCGQDLNEGSCDCPDEDIRCPLGATQRPVRRYQYVERRRRAPRFMAEPCFRWQVPDTEK